MHPVEWQSLCTRSSAGSANQLRRLGANRDPSNSASRSAPHLACTIETNFGKAPKYRRKRTYYASIKSYVNIRTYSADGHRILCSARKIRLRPRRRFQPLQNLFLDKRQNSKSALG